MTFVLWLKGKVERSWLISCKHSYRLHAYSLVTNFNQQRQHALDNTSTPFKGLFSQECQTCGDGAMIMYLTSIILYI